MALNSGWTAIKTAGMASDLNGLKCFEAVVDVTKLTGGQLAQNAWIELFYVPAGSGFLFGTFEILTVDAGSGHLHVDSATSSSHVYHSADNLNTALYTVMDHYWTSKIATADQAAANVYMYAETAAVTTAKVRVRMFFDCKGGAGSQQ
jgi:hypothetical protein